MNHPIKLIAAWAALYCASAAQAGVNADEAARLGASLTAVGAEKAGNKDGTIPPYEGGLSTVPVQFQKGSGIRPDPFSGEKPRLVITGRNLAEHQEKLTAGARELLKRHADFRVDVYPSHRSIAYPKVITDNTARNALGARTVNGGLGVDNVLPGVPFPIPKTGNEAMWNHLLKYSGAAFKAKFDSWNVDASGTANLATTGEAIYTWPIYEPKNLGVVLTDSSSYWRLKLHYTSPARRAGEGMLVVDAVNPLTQPRRAWQYLPGQRRVKMAPSIAYDTPNPGSAGASTYDDGGVFNGALDRFDFKLVGKREVIVPYNQYKLVYANNPAEVLKPKFANPDFVRWELHRVWVIEATLKADKRHVYSKRTFYLDEDSWAALASDEYDGRGQLYRAGFATFTYSYDVRAPQADGLVFYDFVSGVYNLSGLSGQYYGIKYIDPPGDTQMSPDALAGAGVR